MRKIGFAIASLLALGVAPGAPQGGAGALLGKAAHAASGDTLVVTGDGVNVRYGPSTSARVMMRVYHEQQVMELQREGDWVRAEIAGSGGKDGWIHGSLLAPPGGERPGAPKIAAARAAKAPASASPDGAPAAKPATATPGVPTSPGDVAVIGPPAAAPASVVTAGRPETAALSHAEPAAIEPAAAPAHDQDPADLARFRQSVDYLNSRAVSVAGVDLFTDVEQVGDGVVQVAATDAWSTIPPAGQQSYANTLLDRWAAARGSGGPVSVQIVDPAGKVILERTRP